MQNQKRKFCPFSREKKKCIESEKRIEYGGQIDTPQRGRPKKAELLDVNINTGAQNITTVRALL